MTTPNTVDPNTPGTAITPAPAQGTAMPKLSLDGLTPEQRDYFKRLRAENKERRIEAEQLKAEKAALEAESAKKKGDYEKLYNDAQAELQRVRDAVKAAELKALKMQIGHEYGLPDPLVARLSGDDEDAIRQDAEALKAALTALAPTTTPAAPEATITPAPPRVPLGNNSTPTQETDAARKQRIYSPVAGIFSSGGLTINEKAGGPVIPAVKPKD